MEDEKKTAESSKEWLVIMAISGLLYLALGYYIFTSLLPLFQFSGFLGIIATFVMGSLLGVGASSIAFNTSSRIKTLNALMKNLNFHQFKIERSGNRINSYMRRVGQKQYVQINKKTYTLDDNYVYMEDGVPTYYYNESDTLPKKVMLAEKTQDIRDPSILTNLILEIFDWARIEAAKYKNTLMMVMWIILVCAALGLIASALSYFQLGDIAKNVAAQAGMLVDQAKGMVK